MIVTITSRSSRREIEVALKKLHKKNGTGNKQKKVFDAYKYCGVIKLKEDPLTMQKKWRDEWE